MSSSENSRAGFQRSNVEPVWVREIHPGTSSLIDPEFTRLPAPVRSHALQLRKSARCFIRVDHRDGYAGVHDYKVSFPGLRNAREMTTPYHTGKLDVSSGHERVSVEPSNQLAWNC
jgi:hypothetical protein